MKETMRGENKAVQEYLRKSREKLKEDIKKEMGIGEGDVAEMIRRIGERKEKERRALKEFGEKVTGFYTTLSKTIPSGDFCEELEPHCLRLEIFLPADILTLHKNATSGQCDFYNKCPGRREECGGNLSRPLKLSTPDHVTTKYTTKKKEDGEE